MRSSKLVPRTIPDILRDTLRQLEATTDRGKDDAALTELRIHLLRTLRRIEIPSETQTPPQAEPTDPTGRGVCAA